MAQVTATAAEFSAVVCRVTRQEVCVSGTLKISVKAVEASGLRHALGMPSATLEQLAIAISAGRHAPAVEQWLTGSSSAFEFDVHVELQGIGSISIDAPALAVHTGDEAFLVVDHGALLSSGPKVTTRR